MSSRRTLARRLAAVEGFASPDAALEQYPTPAELAAHLVHLADIQGDLAGQVVVDLGTGTGVLALGAALRTPERVLGVERDPAALIVAKRNARTLTPPVVPDWIIGDATRPPLCLAGATVLMNPPFGAQTGHEHADRAFLESAAAIARVSYSVHNAGSRDFLEAFVADRGATLTHAFASEIPIERTFPWHAADREVIGVVVVRIVWTDATADDTSRETRSGRGFD